MLALGLTLTGAHYVHGSSWLLNLSMPLWLLNIVHATYLAHRSPPDYVLRRSNGVLAYLGLYVGAVVSALAFALLIRAFVVEAFQVPADSMVPSVLPGDHMFVTKIGPDNGRPEPGDVVVFRAPPNPTTKYLKRVVAVGGQTVELRDSLLHIDGAQVGMEPCEERIRMVQNAQGRTLPTPCATETLPNGASHSVLIGSRNIAGPRRNLPPQVVPEGHLFVLGDFRTNSSDSRDWGTVLLENVIGRPRTIWMSLGPGGVQRPERVGLTVQ